MKSYLSIGVRYYLYDGGSANKAQASASKNFTKALKKCQREKGTKQSGCLNGIIVSHPDADHFNLIAELFQKNCHLLPHGGGIMLSSGIRFSGQLILTEAFVHRNTLSCNALLQRLHELEFSAVTVPDEKGSHDPIKMAKCFKFHFPLSKDGCRGLVYGKSMSDSGVPEINIRHNFKDWNKSSTIVEVGNAAILTGDAEAETLQSLQNQGKVLQVFQVPHHGSKGQYHMGKISTEWKYLLALRALVNFYESGNSFNLVRHMNYSKRRDVLCVYADYFDYLHSNLCAIFSKENKIDDNVCNTLARLWSDLWNLDLSNSSLALPEAAKTLVPFYKNVRKKLKDRYKSANVQIHARPRSQGDKKKPKIPDLKSLLKQLENEQWKTVLYTKAITDFYKQFPAKVYVISSGSHAHYSHPDEEVLSGIILSVHKSKSILPITLLVTSRDSLEDKIVHLPPDFEVDESSNPVEIRYLKEDIQSVPIDLHRNHDPFSNCKKNYLETWPWINLTNEKDLLILRGAYQLHVSRAYCSSKCEDVDPSLSEYLKIVVPSFVNVSKSISLSSVLQLLIGPQIERHLSQISAKRTLETHNFLETILKLDVKEDSEFVLSGETNCQSAKSAKIKLHMPPLAVKIMGVNAQAVTVEVQNAKCPDTTLKCHVEFPDEAGVKYALSLDYSQLCKSENSIGRPLSMFLSDIGSQSKASDYTVGALLGLTLGAAKAEHLLRMFPIKVSSYVATWNLNLPHTVIDFEMKDDVDLRGVFIVGTTPSQSHQVELSPTLTVQFTSMEMKISLLFLHTMDDVNLRGDCIVNGHDQAVYKSLSNSRGPRSIEIEFDNKSNPSDLLKFFGVGNDSILIDHGHHNINVLGKQLEQCTIVSSGLVIEQPAAYYSHTRIISAFFELDPESLESDVKHLLPEYLKKSLKLNTVRALCMCPPDFSVLGIESIFMCDSLTMTELKLRILPLTEDEAEEMHTPPGLRCHSYHLTLRPLPMPHTESDSEKRQEKEHPSVLAVVETLCPQYNLKDDLLSSFPMVKSVLDSIHLKYFHAEVNPSLHPLSIQCMFYIPTLDIIPEKLTIEEADIDLFYSKDYISISSYCRITVLKEQTCMVNFSLPTPDKEGHFFFRNYSNELTLMCILDGFDLAKSETVSKIPVLSTVLDITIKSISLSLNREYSITEAELTVYKSEIQIGSITLSEVEVTALYTKERSLSFSVQGHVGESLFATLSYDFANSMLSGSITTSSMSGKRVKLSSFISFVEIPNFDVPDKLKETLGFMDLEVLTASIGLMLVPSVEIESLKLRLKSDSNRSLELMSDPKIVLQEVELTIEYQRDSKLNIFVSGSITFTDIVLLLEGEVDGEGMTLKGRVERNLDFIKALDALKPSQSLSLVVPEFSDNIHERLSQMHSMEFLFREQKDKTDIMVVCDSSLETSIHLGGHKIALQSLGAKLCVTIHEKLPVQYSGYVCGCFSVYNFQVKARLALVPAEDKMDVIFIGQCKNVESLNIKTLSNAIEEQQQSTQDSSLGRYLPRKISNIVVENTVIAVNITQKQLFFFLKLKEIGSGLVMLSNKNSSSEYILGFSFTHDFRLERISNHLAAIDKVLIVRELHFVIVAMDSQNLSNIINIFHKVTNETNSLESSIDSFDEDQECAKEIHDFQSAPPLATIHSSDTNFVREKDLKRGFYIYCKLNLVALKQSDSIFCDVIQLSENDFPDIMMSMYIGKVDIDNEGSRELMLSAHVPEIRLFGTINFTNVSLEYHLTKHTEVQLSGDLTIKLGESDLTIAGSIYVSKKCTKFSASKCIDLFSSPLGVTGATLQNIGCDIKFEKENGKMKCEVALTGSVKFNNPALTFKGTVIFKDGRPILLAMTIEGVLKLSDFLAAAFDFKESSEKSFADICLRDGRLVYARESHEYEGFHVQEGFNAMSTLVVMTKQFNITATFTKKPKLEFTIKGSLVGGAINILGLAELKSPDFTNNSVVLGCRYTAGEGFKLLLEAGVTLLGTDLGYKTEVSYSSRGVFEGKIKCAIEYIKDMTIAFTWSKPKGFEIVKWPGVGDFPIDKVFKAFEWIFDIATLISAYATGGISAVIMWLAKYILKKCLKFTFEMDANLHENPHPKRYRVVIGLKLTFVVKLIGIDIFKKDIIKIKVKIGKDDTLKDLPKRIWEGFVEWFKENFSIIFQEPSDDDLAPPSDYLSNDVSFLSEFDKSFKKVTRVVHTMTIIHLNIKAISTMGGKQKQKEKLQALLGKHEKWLNDHKEFINLPCKLKTAPLAELISLEESPKKLYVRWYPPLEDDSGRYSYDIRIKTVDSAGTTQGIVDMTTSETSYECDDPKIAEATLISFEIRCRVKLSTKIEDGQETISSDEDYTLEGEWSSITVLNFNNEHKPCTEPLTGPDPPMRVTVKLTRREGKCFITGNIFLSDITQSSDIIIQLLNGDTVISNQPTILSVQKINSDERHEYTLNFAFNAQEVTLDACGPFSVQAQDFTCVEGEYKKSDITRSKGNIERVKCPNWTTFKYDVKEDRVYASVKSFDEESQCIVEIKNGTSNIVMTSVDSHTDHEGE